MAYFWVITVLLATAVQPILVKIGYRGDVNPLQLLVMKNLISALFVLPMIKYFKMLSLGDIVKIARISLLLLGINGLSLVALNYLPAVTVVTLTMTIPVFVASANFFLKRETLSWKFWLGVLLCLLGVLLAIDVFHAKKFLSSSIIGYLSAFGAISCAVTFRVNMESLTKNFEPKLLIMWAFWINALAAVIFICPFIEPIPSQSMPLSLGIGLAAAVANTAFIWSIKLVGSTLISVIHLLQRPIIIVLTSVILIEPMTAIQWIGVCLVLVGLPFARPKRINA